MSSEEDKLNQLRNLLNDVTEWPTVYMFKFIIPADNKKYAQVESLFGQDAEIYTKQSKKGSYISFSVKEVMLSADDILHVYKRAGEIEGLIAL